MVIQPVGVRLLHTYIIYSSTDTESWLSVCIIQAVPPFKSIHPYNIKAMCTFPEARIVGRQYEKLIKKQIKNKGYEASFMKTVSLDFLDMSHEHYLVLLYTFYPQSCILFFWNPLHCMEKWQRPAGLYTTWSLQTTFSKYLEDYLEATQAEIASVPTRNVKSHVNTSKMFPLTALRRDISVVFKPSDKGRNIAILNHTSCQTEVERHLFRHHYEKLDSSITSETRKLLQETLQDMFT